jgi:hypothetical protein
MNILALMDILAVEDRPDHLVALAIPLTCLSLSSNKDEYALSTAR